MGVDSRATMCLTEGVRTYTVELPALDEEISQDQEWCRIGGTHPETGEPLDRIVTFHEYADIFNIPGLYENLFYEKLKCISPQVVCTLLQFAAEESGPFLEQLRVLDFGAGNGIVGEELRKLNVGRVVGADILPEARQAALRDRPGVYDDFLVADFTALTPDEAEFLKQGRFNALTQVAGLGFGDIPPHAFAVAYNVVEPGGWIAFNIKEDFLDPVQATGFARLIERMDAEGVFLEHSRHRYVHRLSVTGSSLYYAAIVGRKRDDIPMDWVT